MSEDNHDPTDVDVAAFFAQGFRQFMGNAMKAQNISVSMMANATGLSRSYVSKIIKAPEPSQISMSNAHLVCEVLGFELPKVIYALHKQLPKRDRRIRKAEDKPRIRAERTMSRPPTRVVEVDSPTCTPAEALSLINDVELK